MCSCDAQLQPHERFPGVCPLPPTRVDYHGYSIQIDADSPEVRAEIDRRLGEEEDPCGR